MQNNINFYKEAFSNLHVKIVGGRRFPNKAILLISLMDLIRCGYIVDNKIWFDNTLRASFEYNWRIFINHNAPSVWIPFWHMKKESFWHFFPIHSLSNIELLVASGETASLGKMKSEIEYAYLDNELFNIMKEPIGRTELFSVLKANYLTR